MTATTVVALYAALVATGGLAWTIYRHFRSRRRDVLVVVEEGLALRQGMVHADEPKMESILRVVAINRGEAAVFVERLGIRVEDPEGLSAFVHYVGPSIREVPPGERTTGELRSFRDRVDLSREHVGVAELASGEAVRSEPRRSSMLDVTSDPTADPTQTTVGGEHRPR